MLNEYQKHLKEDELNSESEEHHYPEIEAIYKKAFVNDKEIEREANRYQGFIKPEAMTHEEKMYILKPDTQAEKYEVEEVEGPNFHKLILIPNNSNILLVWKPIEIVICLVSSYYYAWLIAFSHNDEK